MTESHEADDYVFHIRADGRTCMGSRITGRPKLLIQKYSRTASKEQKEHLNRICPHEH